MGVSKLNMKPLIGHLLDFRLEKLQYRYMFIQVVQDKKNC